MGCRWHPPFWVILMLDIPEGGGCKLCQCPLPMPRARDVTQNTCSYKKKASCQPQCLWNGMLMVLEKAIFWNTGNAMSTGALAGPPPQLAAPLPSPLTHSPDQPLGILGFLSHSGIAGFSGLLSLCCFPMNSLSLPPQ